MIKWGEESNFCPTPCYWNSPTAAIKSKNRGDKKPSSVKKENSPNLKPWGKLPNIMKFELWWGRVLRANTFILQPQAGYSFPLKKGSQFSNTNPMILWLQWWDLRTQASTGKGAVLDTFILHYERWIQGRSLKERSFLWSQVLAYGQKDGVWWMEFREFVT